MDKSSGEGTHWVAYNKCGNSINYFDSYGNLRPPQELSKYFCSNQSKSAIYYNHDNYQKFDSINCGHLCLKFLYNQLT